VDKKLLFSCVVKALLGEKAIVEMRLLQAL
jgi:hypothetical protein